ncbi:Alpha/Beta hydrolase protein [Hypoxylon sp. FL0543]|nr:Alpha/Beta hydrolase protein [Hypoxylon sp. FL0543]
MFARQGGGGEASSAMETPSEVATGPAHKVLMPDSDAATDRPLIICFHGSGESCSPSWDALARILTCEPHSLRVLLYDRGPLNPKPPRATEQLRECLRREGLEGPYVLVAHSYGGAFARMFLEGDEGRVVVGVVLVETGQESALEAGIEERQYARRVVGMRPLSVVRGNSFLRMWEQVRRAEADASPEDGREVELKAMLRTWESADEEMKKRQLGLAAENGVTRYLHIPDCGHHVVRERPDVVAAEVAWVLENLTGAVGGDVEVDVMEGRGRDGSNGLRRAWREIMGRLFNRLNAKRPT